MPWKKGQSGNPAGKKPGTKNKKSSVPVFVEGNLALQEKTLESAMKGDPTALKVVADRLWPRLRAQMAPVQIDASTDDDVAEQGKKIIDAALSGDVTPDVLRELLMALYAHGRLIELTELDARLRALEKIDGKNPWEVSEPEREKLPLRGKKRRRQHAT